MLAMAILTSVFARRLRLDNLRMRGAINSMSQGLCMFDGRASQPDQPKNPVSQ
jgi:hypothetical protein